MSHVAYIVVLPFEMNLSKKLLVEFAEDKVRRALLTVASVIDVAAASLDWEAEIEAPNAPVLEHLPWLPGHPMPSGTVLLRCIGKTL
jgi:hypothetical protein